MKKRRKLLILLDAHAIIHRAYHALPEFLSSAGEPTGALYGLSTMLMKLITDLKPDYLVACYDLPGKTFRHEAYDGYKGTRVKADDALIKQLQNSRQIFEAFNIPMCDLKGFEADDILGTIAEKLKDKMDIIIASGDMDTLQLVDDKKIQVFTLKKGITDTVLYDEEKVVERYGFKPRLIPDFKGLRGDPSDNIKGIPGIGDKTATVLISQFGSIEEIYKKLKKDDKLFKMAGLTPRVIQLLKDREEDAVFSKTLAKIRTDAPVTFELPKKTFWDTVELKKVEQTFSHFEFRSLFARLKTFFGNHSANPGESEKIPDLPPDLQEVSIALWLINSNIGNPELGDILLYAKTSSFEEAKNIIFKKLKEEKLEKVFEEIEKPLIPIIKKIEEKGVLIDRDYLRNLSKEYHKELDVEMKKIYQMAGTEFNINSPKQLGVVLFGKMGIRSSRKSAGGALSTRVSVLEELEEGNPIIREIMNYRELQKLLSTYVDVIPEMAKEDGRLHARFFQNNTTTGRFSSAEPNLQNLPIKSELGRRIRKGFIAPSGHKLAAFDYSQIELRVIAMLSGDKKMTQIFREKKDIHTGVASFVFGVPIDKVDSEMRRQAKIINFGIIYGMGVTSLRKNLGGTRGEAQKFYDNYFRQFSGVRDYLENVKKEASQSLYTRTLFGRKRNFPNIQSRIPYLQSMALRTAINAPVQGTAADIIKLAIRYAEEDLQKAKLLNKAHLILQVHDELIYEIEGKVVEEASKIIQKAMEDVLVRSYLKYKTEIPLEVRRGVGSHLGEVK